MRHLLFLFLGAFLSHSLSATWLKINDADYVWGPFKIYNIALYSETGEYQVGTRPLMLSLTYAKPVDGRDFAISLARSWSNLGITLPDQEAVVDRLRKMMPNIRQSDKLSYIALEDRGYFILNDQVIPEEFNRDFNDAVVAVWLDERVEIGGKLLSRTQLSVVESKPTESKQIEPKETGETVSATMLETIHDEEQSAITEPEQAEEKAVESANPVSSEAEKAQSVPAAKVETTEKTVEAQQAEAVEIKPQTVEKAEHKEENKVENQEVKPTEPSYPNPEVEVFPPYDPIPFNLTPH